MYKVENHPNSNVKKYCLKHFLIAKFTDGKLIENFVFNKLFDILNQGIFYND